MWPCPVKYRLFKEVSNIIWPLYCNYKVLLLDMVHSERGLPTGTCWVCLTALMPSLVILVQTSLASVAFVSFACIDPDVGSTGQLDQLDAGHPTT